MIQDIAPRHFDNTYHICRPGERDKVLLIRDSRVLMLWKDAGPGAERPDYLRVPSLEEILPVRPNAEREAVYLFAIDDIRYFLVDVAKEEEAPLPEADERWSWQDSRFLRIMDPRYEAFAVVTGIQLYRWRESRRYCGHCGAPTRDSDTERALVCPKCGQIEYPKISPAVIVAITDGDRLLMSRYAGRAYGGYALIAGFVEIGETFEDTVRREVMEEVGLKVKNIRYFDSQPWGFSDTEMVGFFAELDGDDTITLEQDELSMAAWFTRDEIPDEPRIVSIASKLKMAFKYGEDT